MADFGADLAQRVADILLPKVLAHVSPNPRPMMTPAECAGYLQVSEKTLADWRGEGSGPDYVVLGARMVRYRPEDVDLWMEERRK